MILKYMVKQNKKQFIEEIKELLLTQKTRLEKDLNQIMARDTVNVNSNEGVESGEKDDDVALKFVEHSESASVESTLEKSLRDVNKALLKIEEEDYGICKYCEKEINPLRLKARPATSSCVECKTKLKGG